MIEQITTTFKALGEPTRLKIVKLLSGRELCVCELEAVLDMSQPRVSQHLKVLRNAGIVKERKHGQRAFFSLDEVIGTGKLSEFDQYMKTEINALGELSLENKRLGELEENETVKQCKQDKKC